MSQALAISMSHDPRTEAYQLFRSITKRCLDVLQSPNPHTWFRRVCRVLKTVQQDIRSLPEEQRVLLETPINDALNVLLESLRSETREVLEPDATFDSKLLTGVTEHIHRLEQIFFLPETHDTELVTVLRISLELLSERDPERIILSTGAHHSRTLRFRMTTNGDWQEVLLPSRPDVFYKGGFPRILLKLYADADEALLTSEIPINDVDILALGEQKRAVTKEALRLGADLDGVEFVDQLDFESLLRTRDVDLNQCFLGSNELIFSTRALDAALTGTIQIEAEDRGIYGSEYFYFEKIRLVKNRGIYRLIKFVAEQKASAFFFLRLNRQVDYGIYWLVSVRKFMRKPNMGTLLNRLFELGRRIGQVYPHEQDIYDVLTRVHSELPFFSFTQGQLDQIGLSRWLAGKLVKMADRYFRLTHGIPSEMDFERFSGDTIPDRISLDGYVDDPNRDAQTFARWSAFVEACEQRRCVYLASQGRDINSS